MVSRWFQFPVLLLGSIFFFYIPHALHFYCKVFRLYFIIFSESFLITLLFPEIAAYINIYFIFYYHGLYCPVYCYGWFCQLSVVCSRIWLCHFRDLFLLILDSYQCLFSNFTHTRLHMVKCS
jgi:hypothetical protein